MAAQANTEAAPSEKKSGKKSGMIIVAALMLVEGVGVFFLANALAGKPHDAAAEEVKHIETKHEDKWANPPDAATAEVMVAQCKPTNTSSGRLVYHSVRVSIVVDRAKLAGVQKMVEQYKGRLEDAVNRVIRTADARQLKEPTLEMLKRRLKSEFDRILMDDKVIEEVVIPELIQVGGG